MRNYYYRFWRNSGRGSSLKKPVLILRNSTERDEVIENNSAILVGTVTENIVKNANTLLNNKDIYRKMTEANNPFGDGQSSKYILKECLKYLSKKQTNLINFFNCTFNYLFYLIGWYKSFFIFIFI